MQSHQNSVKFTVHGEPGAKGRPRFSPATGKTYTPQKTVAYENLVKIEYLQQAGNFKFPDDAMLDVRIMAYFGIPKSATKKKRQMMLAHEMRPTKKPDYDNIGKIICDSLNKVAYHDDSAIVDAQIRKFYSCRPRVEVNIIQIGGEQ